MKTSHKLVMVSALVTSAAFAQQEKPFLPCITDHATEYYFQTHPQEKVRYEKEMKEATLSPEYAAKMAANNQRLNGNNAVQNATSWPLDTIPVVFHILHMGGPENVPNSYIYQALAEVNRVHTKTIPDTAGISPLFKGVSGANNYVFQLATKDPSGNCTNGILHYYDANTNWSQTNPGYNYTWDRTKYLNVYIVKEICQSTAPCSQSGGIVVGYTYLPGTVSSAYDAIVYNYQFLTGTNARSLAHEFGHWLGLSHTFGSTNSPGTCMSGGNSDDFLATNPPSVACVGVTDDTPKYYGAFSTCPSSSSNSCDVSNTANVQNIMDYSSCPKNFTWGQIQRMHNIMNSTVANRKNVTSAANKIATGVRYPQVCIPTPYFHASARIVCAGTTITFSDSSQNAHATSWKWNFPGGTLAGASTLNDSMPQVTYSTPGMYAVSYTAGTSAGAASITQTSYINVQSSVATYNTNFTEGFESSAVPGTDWSVTSTQNVNWAVTSSAAASGSKSVMIQNISNIPGDTSNLISNTFNVQAIGSPIMTFQMSYQQQATSNMDKLQIYSSIDCGNTWQTRWVRSGVSLQPSVVSGTSTTPFVPTPSQFATYTINLAPVSASTNARFKFTFYADPSAPGNNIYLDNINIINSTTGIQTFEEKINLSVYPNPSSGRVNVAFSLSEKHQVSVTVTDMLGRVVENIAAQNYASGESIISLASNNAYQAGVYAVCIHIDGQQVTKKIVIE
ncbi:MAG: T9SS type A sorting domain-containing protein [Bacteroidetes bacterium]|nr:T9SS type A sorting domain-containing protein [Bacteroidota bacterium]